MGASVGVFMDHLSPDLKEAVELTQKMKSTISEHDSTLLERETSKVFKKHGAIIQTLTSRTKAQLKRTIEAHGKAPEDIYKTIGGNNNYALFMKQLHMSKQDIEMENLKNSSKVELYDEEMLVNIIGTSSNKELKLFCEMYSREKGTDLWDVFASKLKPDSQLQKFLKLVCKCDRDEAKNHDSLLAAEQAAEIHKAGAARLIGCDEDLIFKILTRSSRAQCAAIADSYLMQFHIKFERAINMKFKGNCGKLLLLYVLPLPNAIISCIHAYEDRMLIDKVAIISMVSKYDKDVLAQVDAAAEKMYEKNLIGIVQRGLSGNLLRAVQGWIENPSPDKGYERVTELFIETQQVLGRSLDELIKKDEFQNRLLFLVRKEHEELENFMRANRIKFIANTASSPTDRLNLSAISTMDSFDAHHIQNALHPPATREILNKYSMKEPEERTGTDYQTKYVALQKYFKAYFTTFDSANVGYFPEEEFWEIMKKLPLEALGLNDAEVEQMSTWCEWVQDGRIHYHEAVFELADSMITSIEGKCEGETDVMKVLEVLSKHKPLKKAASEAKVGRHGSVQQISAVPDYFMQYLYDTFFAYDLDNNGYLCKKELDLVLPVLNLGMVYTDFIPDVKARISHKNAAQIIARKIQPWFLDKENDNYICLVDKDSGLFFWFNCKDESSQWADTEGEGWAGYGSRRASSAVPDLVYSNSLVGSCKNLVPGGFGTGSTPPRSPRAPTHAEEKEAAGVQHSIPSPFASPGKKVERKMQGIAELAEGESTRETAAADAKDGEQDTKTDTIVKTLSSKEQGDKETTEERTVTSMKIQQSVKERGADLTAESKEQPVENADAKHGVVDIANRETIASVSIKRADEPVEAESKKGTKEVDKEVDKEMMDKDGVSQEESKKESVSASASPRTASPQSVSPRRGAVSSKDPPSSNKTNADTAPPAPSSPRPPASPRAGEVAIAVAASAKVNSSMNTQGKSSASEKVEAESEKKADPSPTSAPSVDDTQA